MNCNAPEPRALVPLLLLPPPLWVWFVLALPTVTDGGCKDASVVFAVLFHAASIAVVVVLEGESRVGEARPLGPIESAIEPETAAAEDDDDARDG